MADWYSDRAVGINVEELHHDICDVVAWMHEECRDCRRSFSPELVVRTVVNAVRAVNISYTDGIVLVELEKLKSEFIGWFDELKGGAFSSILPKKGANIKQL